MSTARRAQTHALSIDATGDVAAVDAHRSISLVRLSEPAVVHKLLRHKESRWSVGSNVRWCHASPNQSLLASTCHNVALVWNPGAATHPVVVLREHKRSVNSVCWHPLDESNTAVATCSADSFIHLWDVRQPQRPVISFCAWTAGATKIEWSLSDEHVLASSHDNEVRLWDRRKGTLSQPTAFITAHRHNVRALSWRPGAPRTLLTVGQDGAVRLWDTDEPRDCKGELQDGNVQMASWTPGGEAFVSAGGSSGVALWSLHPNQQHGSNDHLLYPEYEYQARAAASFHEGEKDCRPGRMVRDMAWRRRYTHSGTGQNASVVASAGGGGDDDDGFDGYELWSVSVDGELRPEAINSKMVTQLCGDNGAEEDSWRQRRWQNSTAPQSSQPIPPPPRTLSEQWRQDVYEPSSRHTIALELKLLEENWSVGRVTVEKQQHDLGQLPSALLRIKSQMAALAGQQQQEDTEDARGQGGVADDTTGVLVSVTFPAQYPRGGMPVSFKFLSTSTSSPFPVVAGTDPFSPASQGHKNRGLDETSGDSAPIDDSNTEEHLALMLGGDISALEEQVSELAGSLAQAKSLSIIACVERIINQMDNAAMRRNPAGPRRAGRGPDGDSSAGNTDGSDCGLAYEPMEPSSRGRVGSTPSPVLSAGLFSGPGLFVTFNNGLPGAISAASDGVDGGVGGGSVDDNSSSTHRRSSNSDSSTAALATSGISGPAARSHRQSSSPHYDEVGVTESASPLLLHFASAHATGGNRGGAVVATPPTPSHSPTPACDDQSSPPSPPISSGGAATLGPDSIGGGLLSSADHGGGGANSSSSHNHNHNDASSTSRSSKLKSAQRIIGACTVKTYQHMLWLLDLTPQDAANPNLSIAFGVDQQREGVHHGHTGDDGGELHRQPSNVNINSSGVLGHTRECALSATVAAVEQQRSRRLDRQEGVTAQDQGVQVPGVATAADAAVVATAGWNMVSIRSDRAFIDLELAALYNDVLSALPKDMHPRQACKLNSMHAERRGYMQVAQAWVLCALAIEPLLAPQSSLVSAAAVEQIDETIDGTTHRASSSEDQPLHSSVAAPTVGDGDSALHRRHSWDVHPLGRSLIENVISVLVDHGDMQSVAVLACIMHGVEERVNLEQPVSAQQQPLFELLGSEMRQSASHMMDLYAWILGCRGMVLEAAAVRSMRWVASHSGEPFAATVRSPVLTQPGATAARGSSGILCSVCRLPVKGLSNACALCGHTGHATCLRGWFVGACKSSCPAGCDCTCARLASLHR